MYVSFVMSLINLIRIKILSVVNSLLQHVYIKLKKQKVANDNFMMFHLIVVFCLFVCLFVCF